jgi:hypothetical protein
MTISNTKGSNKKSTRTEMTTVTIMSPQHATELFRSFMQNTDGTPYKMPGSRRKFYSVRQAVGYYRSQNQKIHGGWFGRALTAASSMPRSGVTRAEMNLDGTVVGVYSVAGV